MQIFTRLPVNSFHNILPLLYDSSRTYQKFSVFPEKNNMPYTLRDLLYAYSTAMGSVP